MDKKEFKDVINLSYSEYCDYLKEKYGEVPYSYGNSKNNATGLFIHHIGEIKETALSDVEKRKKPEFAQFQKPEMLVYCNYLEHFLLHIKIGEEADILREEQLGLGGPFKWIIPAINKYYTTGYKNYNDKYYNCLNNNKDVFDALLEYYNEIVKANDVVMEENAVLYEQVRETIEKNNKALVVLGTGLGKTTTALQYLYENNCRALVITPNTTIKNDWSRYGDWTDTTTYQAFANNYESVDYNQYGIVIIDEAHHAGFDEENDKGAIVWGKAIQYLIDNNIKLLGLTATPKRADGIDIGETLFKSCVCEGRSIEDAIENGDVHPFNYITSVYDAESMVEEERNRILGLTDDDLKTRLIGQLDLALNDVPAVYDILNKYIKSDDRRGIIFVQDINDMDLVLNIFKKAMPGVEIRYIHSNMNPDIVEENRKWFADENTKGYLMAINMVSEGVHYPKIDTIIMFRRTQSFLVYTQQIGRIVTLATKENPNAIVFDLVNNINSIRYNDKVVDRDRGQIPRIREALQNTEAFKSGQIIVADESVDFINRIREIKGSYGHIFWSEQEVEILKIWFPIEGWNCATRLPLREKNEILSKAFHLGLASPKSIGLWDKEAVEMLKKLYPIYGPECYEKIPGKNRDQVKRKAAKLGLSFKRFVTWTNDERNILRTYYPTEGSSCYKRFIDKTEADCRREASRLKIKVDYLLGHESEVDEMLKEYYVLEGPKCFSRIPNVSAHNLQRRADAIGLHYNSNRTYWTDSEVEALITNYKLYGSACFSMFKNHTYTGCQVKVKRLGLRRTDKK